MNVLGVVRDSSGLVIIVSTYILRPVIIQSHSKGKFIIVNDY